MKNKNVIENCENVKKIRKKQNKTKTPKPPIKFKLASNIRLTNFKINAENTEYLLCTSHSVQFNPHNNFERKCIIIIHL